MESPEGVDLLFVAVPAAERFEVASDALRGGTHVFLEWPPTTSIRECARLVRLAEEAGLEVAVARPLRAALHDVPANSRARVISIGASASTSVVSTLADVVDLACEFAGSASIQRVEAEASYDDRRMMTAIAVSLRFHSGAFAQAIIRSDGPEGIDLFAAGNDLDIERRVVVDREAVQRETRAVVGAIQEGRPPPVSILDAMHTLRIVERVMGVLR